MDNKEKIMAAGLELFSTQSYHQTGIRALTSLVEMPTGSFHYYFKNKEDFTLAVLEYFFSKEITPAFSKISKDESLNAKQKVITYFKSRITHYVTASTEQRTLVSCVMGNLGQDIAAQSEAISSQLKKMIDEQIVAGLIKLIAKGQEDGEIKTEIKAEILGSMIFNTYEGTMIQRKISRSDSPFVQFLDFLAQLL
jgi:TetR/AcrR family transcriptional repressor of nem operon